MPSTAYWSTSKSKDTLVELFALRKEQIVEDPLNVNALKEAIVKQLTSQTTIQAVNILRQYETSVQKRSTELFRFLNQI